MIVHRVDFGLFMHVARLDMDSGQSKLLIYQIDDANGFLLILISCWLQKFVAFITVDTNHLTNEIGNARWAVVIPIASGIGIVMMLMLSEIETR